MDLKEESILGDSIYDHWYYISKSRAMRAFLKGLEPRVILDVGAGSGIFSKILLQETSAQQAICVDIGYPGPSEEVFAGKLIQFRTSVSKTEADLALFMDVIEHVDDDISLLRSYVSNLRKGAHVLITVPAFQFLFSGHDLFLEHRRRYTLPRVEAVVREAGLEVVKGSYFFAIICPIAVVQRLAQKVVNKSQLATPKSSLKKHMPIVNGALKLLNALELPLLPFNRLVGLTVFCLARVP